jgi:hypothetical protein
MNRNLPLAGIAPDALTGRYAVFRRRNSGRAYHFGAIHPTFDAAEAEAARLTAQAANETPEKHHVYMVVRIEAGLVWMDGRFERVGVACAT